MRGFFHLFVESNCGQGWHRLFCTLHWRPPIQIMDNSSQKKSDLRLASHWVWILGKSFLPEIAARPIFEPAVMMTECVSDYWSWLERPQSRKKISGYNRCNLELELELPAINPVPSSNKLRISTITQKTRQMASKHGIISFFPETDLFPYIHNKIHWRIVTFLDDLYSLCNISDFYSHTDLTPTFITRKMASPRTAFTLINPIEEGGKCKQICNWRRFA